MSKKSDFSKNLGRFFTEYIPHERGLSHNTITSYRDCFVLYLSFMHKTYFISPDRMSLEDLTKERLLAFLDWLEQAKGCSTTTRNSRLAAIHSFVRYLQFCDIDRMEEWSKILSIKPKKVASQSVNYLTVDGIRSILAQPDLSSPQGRRHFSILALMYDTGARVQEIADLTFNSVQIESKPYTLKLVGKGCKARIVPIVEQQAQNLRAYLNDNKDVFENNHMHPLFFNSRGERLTRAGITYILHTYVELARKDNPDIIPAKVSCHSLRHSKAMHLLQDGVNLVYIRDLLGHSSVVTTEIYAKSDSKAKRAALEKAYSEMEHPNLKMGEWEENKELLNWLKMLGK